MKTLFVDCSHMLIRCLFSQKELIGNPNPDFSLHKHLFLSTLIANIKKFEPEEVVIAIDDKNNWRKHIYPEYKANRKEKRDKDLFPWDLYYAYVDVFLAEVKEIFPFKMIQIPYAEADDVIAILARNSPEKSVVITSDGDYIQLLKEHRIRIWDPIKAQYMEDADPAKTLHIKILAGDSGDNVPNVKPKLGPKTAEKLIAGGELDKYLAENNLTANYERNKTLVDWDYIPDVVKKRILETYYDTQTKDFKEKDFFMFCLRNRLRAISEQSQEIGFLMRTLNKPKEEMFE